jgi:hypothetical protein
MLFSGTFASGNDEENCLILHLVAFVDFVFVVVVILL